MNSNQLESVFRKWDPETETVNVIKTALDEFGSFEMAVEDPSLVEAIVHIGISEDFEEEIDELPPEKQFNVLTCDFNGNCLIINDDKNEIKHISELY